MFVGGSSEANEIREAWICGDPVEKSLWRLQEWAWASIQCGDGVGWNSHLPGTQLAYEIKEDEWKIVLHIFPFW